MVLRTQKVTTLRRSHSELMSFALWHILPKLSLLSRLMDAAEATAAAARRSAEYCILMLVVVLGWVWFGVERWRWRWRGRCDGDVITVFPCQGLKLSFI